MTIYNEILKALDEPKPLKKHSAELLKFFKNSEDPKLKNAISVCITEIHHLNSYADDRQRPCRLTIGDNMVLAHFVGQIRKFAKNQKPEWQVIALREGWTPPQQKTGVAETSPAQTF